MRVFVATIGMGKMMGMDSGKKRAWNGIMDKWVKEWLLFWCGRGR